MPLRPAEPWLGWARARDHVGASAARIAAPEPRPPVALRPRKLSRLAHRDLARQPLRDLRARHPAARAAAAARRRADAALRGSIVHEALSRFASAVSRALPADAERELVAIARDVLAGYAAHRARRRLLAAALRALRRLVRRDRAGAPRRRVARSSPRSQGKLVLDGAGRAVHADRARRPHRRRRRRRSSSPTTRPARCRTTQRVIAGSAPQLPLEAAIALGEAGFAKCRQRTRRRPALHPRLRRRAARRGARRRRATTSPRSPTHALDGLARLIARFDDAATPYARCAASRFAYDYDDYAHLARVAEWSAVAPSDEEPCHDRALAARRSGLARSTRAQARAADPGASVWVSANAGTGKTHVLTMRVLRLLLAGTPPERILCLTYTKAAAAEMSKRVFDTLAELGDDARARSSPARSRELIGREPAAAEIARARTLFTRAIETPGGLKVQTIHAFCERLLQRFPLEAGVPPGFTILDERDARTLLPRGDRRACSTAAAQTGRRRGPALETRDRLRRRRPLRRVLLRDALRQRAGSRTPIRMDDAR